MDLHVEDIRRDYKVGSLSKKDMPADPIKKMEEWLEEAIHQKVIEPTAIIVATSTPDGHPSTRTVLLKELKDGKVIFYSNYESRKGQQILANPHVSVTFLWHQLERQIHVEGICQHVAPEVSDAYFSKRPYMSRDLPSEPPDPQPCLYRSRVCQGEPKVYGYSKKSPQTRYVGRF